MSHPVMRDVNYNGRRVGRHNVSSYFCCRIRLEGLLWRWVSATC